MRKTDIRVGQTVGWRYSQHSDPKLATVRSIEAETNRLGRPIRTMVTIGYGATDRLDEITRRVAIRELMSAPDAAALIAKRQAAREAEAERRRAKEAVRARQAALVEELATYGFQAEPAGFRVSLSLDAWDALLTELDQLRHCLQLPEDPE